MARFAFGKNWTAYANRALTEARLTQARSDFDRLFGDQDINHKRFVDIGFGQGLSLCIATERGAEAIGIDIDQHNLDAISATANFFRLSQPPHVCIASILETKTLDNIGGKESFDIVHSWGVLHHTGDMNLAIQNAASLVKPEGTFVIAIYNRHWSCATWWLIKWLYCHMPTLIQRLMIMVFYPIILLAKALVTGSNPFKMDRGMDFMYNVIDWVGGYPFEYGSVDEIRALVEPYGFTLVKSIPPDVPTGCNEFIFIRNK